MNKKRILSVLCSAALISLPAVTSSAAENRSGHRLLLFEYGKGPNRLLELDANGKIIWEHQPPSIAVIFQVLPNGNILAAHESESAVREVDIESKVV